MKGTFSMLGITIVIDISIVTGSAADGGGIHMFFGFKWVVPGTNIELAYIAGHFDVVPLEFDKLVAIGVVFGPRYLVLAVVMVCAISQDSVFAKPHMKMANSMKNYCDMVGTSYSAKFKFAQRTVCVFVSCSMC